VILHYPILDSLIPYLRDNSDPTPLSKFFGNRVVDPTSFKGDLGEVSLPEAEPTKAYAWSRGLKIEYSPIKMRSSRKNYSHLLLHPLWWIHPHLTVGNLEL
jgi:hypothetical protein